MNSTECGAYACVLFDEIDAALQIVAAEKDVVENGGHSVVSLRANGECGQGRAAGKEKTATREHGAF